ncbi:MAG TPA: hypothetical protein VHO47_04735 [Candidatus Babeliales bacterium]|nr:hypothetical protein [Candidatus Babeliales bacterium]
MKLLKGIVLIILILLFANSNQQILAAQKSQGWTVKKATFFGAKIALLGTAGYITYFSGSALWEHLKRIDLQANRRKIYQESYDHPWIALGVTALIVYAGYYLMNSCLDDVKSPSES